MPGRRRPRFWSRTIAGASCGPDWTMTRLSQPIEFQTGFPTRRVERFIALERAALAWERFWPALWPASGLIGLFIALALTGMFAPLPWNIRSLVLSAVITASGVLLYLNLRTLAWPKWEDGARRLERDSGFVHRPVSEGADEIFAGAGDSLAEELWRAHLHRRLGQVLRFRLSLPPSGLQRKDPRALRFVVILVLVTGLGYAGRDSGERIISSFLSASGGAGATADAWVDPPPYTGEPPLYLRAANTGTIAVPAGSILNLRVHGADHAPGLSLGGSHRAFDGSNGEYGTVATISDDTEIRVRASGRELGDWSLQAVPDHPPIIQFAAAPSSTEHGAVRLAFRSRDD